MEIFVYGTLTDPETAGSVLDEFEFAGEATLVGLHRVDGEYPTLAPGGRVDGRILVTDDIESLDRYEGVDRGLYLRVPIPVDSGEDHDHVETYVGDPSRLGVAADWPGEGTFPQRVRSFLADADVVLGR